MARSRYTTQLTFRLAPSLRDDLQYEADAKGDRFARLPAGTVRIDGQFLCAHVAGLPFTPCARVEKSITAAFAVAFRPGRVF
jgi:hypothetical protein